MRRQDIFFRVLLIWKCVEDTSIIVTCGHYIKTCPPHAHLMPTSYPFHAHLMPISCPPHTHFMPTSCHLMPTARPPHTHSCPPHANSCHLCPPHAHLMPTIHPLCNELLHHEASDSLSCVSIYSSCIALLLYMCRCST